MVDTFKMDLDPDQTMQCGLCSEIMAAKDLAAHIQGSHDNGMWGVPVHMVYMLEQSCSTCGARRKYVAGLNGCGLDCVPHDNWHCPCPNVPKKPGWIDRIKAVKVG